MNERATMHRLIWKDILTIKPLMVAAVVAAIALNILALLVYRGNLDSFRADEAFIGWSIALWIILPNFVALGAPAMLVGNEEELGTFAWLRTLPIRWQQIATAKFLVGIVAVLAAWAVTSFILWLVSFSWNFSMYSEFRDFFSISGVALIAFYSGSLLLLGFTAVYLIRSPFMALIALLPTYLVFVMMMAVVVEQFGGVDSRTVTREGWLLGIGALFALWLCQSVLARRRLLLPTRNAAFDAVVDAVESNYSPPRLRIAARPSQVSSLLWQQLRQTGPLCLALIAVSSFLSLIFCVTQAGQPWRPDFLHFVGSFSPMFILLIASWIGATAFYGDNIGGRCAFFADRGISPTRVWWTRLTPPAIGFVVMSLFIVLSGLAVNGQAWDRMMGGVVNILVLTAVLFAFGQLVSQWTKRPMLAFFAAPAYGFIALIPVFYLLDRYQGTIGDGLGVIVLAVPVLLFATWQLTGAWLEGRVEGNYSTRVIAYTAVAILLPCLCIVGLDGLSRPQRNVRVHERAAEMADRTPDAYLAMRSDSPKSFRADSSLDTTP